MNSTEPPEGFATCERCGDPLGENDDIIIGAEEVLCASCQGKRIVDRFTEDEIERFLRLHNQISKYVSFGKEYSMKLGEYVPYVGIWGTKVTDPQIIKLITEAHELIVPEPTPSRDEVKNLLF